MFMLEWINVYAGVGLCLCWSGLMFMLKWVCFVLEWVYVYAGVGLCLCWSGFTFMLEWVYVKAEVG